MCHEFVVFAGLQLGQQLLDALLNLSEFRNERPGRRPSQPLPKPDHNRAPTPVKTSPAIASSFPDLSIGENLLPWRSHRFR
jgi:hypothetical protein